MDYISVPTHDFFLVDACLVAAALIVGFVFFYSLGAVLLHGRLKDRSAELDIRLMLPVLVGAWALSVGGVALGLLHLFTPQMVFLIGVVLVVLRYRQKGKQRPKGLREWLRAVKAIIRENPFVSGFCALGVIVNVVLAYSQVMSWFDDNFAIAAGHLVRTGAYPLTWSRGHEGMAIMTALTGLFFPHLSVLNSMMGWGPFYAILLIVGSSAMIHELYGKMRWAPAGVLILLTPLFARSFDIRSSVTGFTFMLWSLFFLVKYLRTRAQGDLLGASFGFAAAWQYGQVGVLFGLPTVLSYAVYFFLTGNKNRCVQVCRVLAYAALLEAIPSVFGFAMIHVENSASYSIAPVLASLWPIAIVIAFPWALLAGLSKVSAPKLPTRVLGVVVLGFALAAFFLNPPWDPGYSWLYFNTPVDFLELNFTSFGLLGILFAIGIVWALYDSLRGMSSPVLEFLLLGFLANLGAHVACPLFLKWGVEVPAGRAQIWNFWKDATYCWTNILMVVAVTYPIAKLASLKRSFSLWFTPKRYQMALVIPTVFCVQSALPYIEHWREIPKGWAFVVANKTQRWSGPGVQGQQIYSVPLYLEEALWRRQATRRADCVFCSMHVFSRHRLIDYFQEQEIGASDTFVTSASVLSAELYIMRQVRYSQGPNTIHPVYSAYLPYSTSHEFYWQPKARIRRGLQGMAYTVENPKRNLVWVDFHSLPDGSAEGRFQVPYSGRFEAIFGNEAWKEDVDFIIDGRPVENRASGSYGADLGSLDTGRKYTIQVRPRPGRTLDLRESLVIYPWRFWNFELETLGPSGDPFSAVSIMRLSGIPSALVTVEELTAMMTEKDPARLRADLDRYHIRWILMDAPLKKIFPAAEANLSATQLFKKTEFTEGTLYELKG